MNPDELDESEEQDLYEHFSISVDPGQEPLRIDVFLTNRIQNATRTKIQKAAQAGNILVNGKAIKPNYKAKPLDQISIVLPEPPRDTELHAEPMDLDIVHEDDDLLILNKPAGLVVHPGYNNYNGTLVHGLLYHFGSLPSRSDLSRPGLVHRIDKDTSGLLVIAKTEFALNHLAKQFYDHSIERSYFALVWGDVIDDSGTVDAHLARDPKDRRRSAVTLDTEFGKRAITHYKVVERFRFLTLITCNLETGRTHQIRAHMKHIGHPLFNDAIYGGDIILKGMNHSKFQQFIQNCFGILSRQALHAYSLGFVHPTSGKNMLFKQELPSDFGDVLEKLRKYVKSYHI
jgi:23S rRNA pseudouridine1911/1915/1917 synthase